VKLTGEQNSGFRLGEPRPTALSAAGSRSGNSGLGPLLNQATFELGEGGEDVENEFARGTRSVDHPVADRPEPDTRLPQVPDDGDEMPHGSSEPVQSLDDQRVAGLQGLQAAAEAGSIVLTPDSLSVKFRFCPTPCWASASSCRLRFWSSVLTRAYPTRRPRCGDEFTVVSLLPIKPCGSIL